MGREMTSVIMGWVSGVFQRQEMTIFFRYSCSVRRLLSRLVALHSCKDTSRQPLMESGLVLLLLLRGVPRSFLIADLRPLSTVVSDAVLWTAN